MKRLLISILASLCTTSIAFATININEASEHDFQTLDGIGPNRAKRIVQYRRTHGKFQKIQDIKNVPGIDVVYERIKNDIAISGENIPPEGAMAKVGKKLNKAARKTKEKTSAVVKDSAESMEKTAHSIHKKAAESEAEAAR